MRMSRVLVVAVVALALGAVVGGGLALAFQHRSANSSNQPAPTGTFTYPTSPNDLLLRISMQGGPTIEQAVREPAFSLYGDGTVIVTAPAQHGGCPSGSTPCNGPTPPPIPSAVPDLRVASVTAVGIQSILAQAGTAGLFGPNRTYSSDVPSNGSMEVFALSLGSLHRTVSFTESASQVANLPPPGAAAGDRLAGRRFVDLETKLLGLSSWLPAGAIGTPTAYLTFDRMAVYVNTASPGQPSPPSVKWPLSTPLAAFGQPSPVDGYRCAMVSGAELANLVPVAKRATVDAKWVSGGKAYKLVFRPILPGDPGC